MNVSVAYLAVVLIWSTTPLGIVWSSESVSPTLAVLSRMLIATVFGGFMIRVFKIKFPINRLAIKLYCYSGLGIFGGMTFSYMAAPHISSGMMSLIFGLAPVLAGLLAQKILNEPKFGLIRKLAMILSFVGLGIVCSDNLALDGQSTLGVFFILIAVFFFSLSSVLVKSVDIKIHAISTTVGALLISLPLFILIWLIMDGTLPVHTWGKRSIWAIVYLGIFGSLIGFIAYYFILQKLNTSTVALITMMTPAIALSLGAYLNNEAISLNLVIGALFVIMGLMLYNWGDKLVFLKRKGLQV
ncbi:DMT family transporter [Pseudoalteromonas denitrificans]|uniref:EamA-like transporter family protein n=1 Tax=Pseudoalteromonas denitrificans DSM 6059 TaxID=1123010 RepID=A0A1I1KQF5_9GAMM|nr:DMT family transporter [Pseudoalteromonas denitrificans]SFC62502.1 EamA-like transporter family protein [Pseudoalteromonas denitrificans DSM 6059]